MCNYLDGQLMNVVFATTASAGKSGCMKTPITGHMATQLRVSKGATTRCVAC